MTFDPSVPNAAQSPGLFPPQNNTNFGRLKTIINADHVFNDTTQTTDGMHRQATLVARAQPVALPVGSNGILYAWVDGSGQTQLRFYNGNSDFQITPGIVAMVNFDGTGGTGSKTMRSQINVTSVIKTANGRYTINFTTAMPNNNYIVQVCGHGQLGTNGVSNGAVDGTLPYNTAVQTTNVKVQFNGSGSSLNDVTGGFVVIMRAS